MKFRNHISLKFFKVYGSVWQEGCLVKTCTSGTVVDSLAKECAKLIENEVDKMLDEKLGENDNTAINEAVMEDGKYKNPGDGYKVRDIVAIMEK